jgi:hypothetical protein
VTRDLLALAFANGCVVLAGHGVLRAIGFGPSPRDLPWSLGVAYLAGAAAVGVLGSILLVAGFSLAAWQLVLLCAAVFAVGLLTRRGELRRPTAVPTLGLLRVFPWATAIALAILAVDLAVQPIWTDDAWSIWTIKATSIVELDGLDPRFLSSAAVFNADYPVVVPVLELTALRFAGWPTELVPLQLGLLFVAFPAALVALLRESVRPLVLWTVVLGVAVAPTLQVQTASAVADVPLAVFFALAGLAGWRWVETRERELLLLAGVLAAAAAGTKAEGIVFVTALFTALAIASRSRAPVLVGVGATVTLVPWELWSRRHDLGNAIAEAGGASIGPISRLPDAGLELAKELADPTSWLALVALGCAAVAVGFLRHERRAATFTAAVALACVAAVLAAYWTTPLDFDYHVATSVRRVVTAPVLFVAAMTPLLLGRSPVREPS